MTLPPAAWFGFQQGLLFTMRDACTAAGVPLGPIWGLASLVACAVAARIAWSRRAGGTGTDRFLARIAMFVAGLFSLAITYQTLATMIVPPCAR
jgi:hypothetical protein